MEGKDNKPAKHKDGETIIYGEIRENVLIWQETVTVIDLSGRNINTLDDNVKLPVNLVHLNLSRNNLSVVPKNLLKLEKLKTLLLSYNVLEYFDDCPKFCRTLELLDLSHNNLKGPPYWVWTENPQHLTKLNLSNNINITESFIGGYFEELLQYNTLATEIHIQNCKIGKYKELIGTFSKAKSLYIGAEDYTSNANSLIEVPCKGLDRCCDLRSLKVCNTHIYVVSPSIEVYKSLVEINLAQNDLTGLPDEFCALENLEVCVLSYNKILYLPDVVYKMHKLQELYLDSNELCMLPETLSKLTSLKVLDLYDNCLNEMVCLVNLEELDVAQNYFDEPVDNTYLERKEKIRLLHENRCNGRKKEIIRTEDEYSEGEERSSQDEDDVELYEVIHFGKKIDSPLDANLSSSSEDWDSDEYWVPCHVNQSPATPSWLSFVKQKMSEGNFCPMDAHLVSVSDKVQYERMCNPQVVYESDGQFDDYSSDNT